MYRVIANNGYAYLVSSSTKSPCDISELLQIAFVLGMLPFDQ